MPDAPKPPAHPPRQAKHPGRRPPAPHLRHPDRHERTMKRPPEKLHLARHHLSGHTPKS